MRKRNPWKTRLTALLLSVCMLLSLAACGSSDSSTSDSAETNSETASETADSAGSAETAEAAGISDSDSDPDSDGTGYQVTYGTLDTDSTYISGSLVYDGQLWLTGGYYDYDAFVYCNTLTALDDTGAVTEEIIIADDSSTSIYTMCLTEDGVLALVYIYNYEASEETDSEETEWDYGDDGGETEAYYAINTYTRAGELVSSAVIPEDDSVEYFYVEDMAADADGNLYYYMDSMLYACDSDLNILYTVEVLQWMYDLIPAPDGRILVCYYDEDWNPCTAFLDPDRQALGEKLELGLDSDLYSYSYSFGPDGCLYAWTENTLYYCDLEQETAVKLCDWLDWDVDGNNLTAVAGLTSGDLLAAGYDSWTGDPLVIQMQEVPLSELPEKIELTYGTGYLDYDLRQAILSWNRQNDTYHITVVDYSDSTTDSSGYTQFERDILSGSLPDILDAASLDITALRRQDLLVDLYTLMGEETYTRDDFVQGYLQAEEDSSGALYTISPLFRMVTLLGAAEYVGTEQGWTLEEFSAAAEAFPETGVIWDGMTSGSFLLWVLECAFDTYVDLESGTCSFDSQEFIDLLNAAALFPEDTDYYSSYDSGSAYLEDDDYYRSRYSRLTGGSEMLQSWTIYYLDDLRSSKADALVSEDLTLAGVPGAGGNGAFIITDYDFAITTACAYPEAAWDFLCSLLEEDFVEQYAFGLPALQSVFDTLLEEAMTPSYYIDADGNQVENEDYPALTQEQADALVSLVENVSGKYVYDEKIETIVSDAAAAFFAGSKSAESVAAAIQDRVQTYLDEQS